MVNYFGASLRGCLLRGEALGCAQSLLLKYYFFAYCVGQTGIVCLFCPRQWGKECLACKRFLGICLHHKAIIKIKAETLCISRAFQLKIISKKMFLLTKTLTHGVNRLHAIRLSSSAYFQGKPHIMLSRLHLHCLCSDHFVWARGCLCQE